MKKAKCVFLDRDGVLNEDDINYVFKVEKLIILEGVSEALRMLKREGYLLIVITNQSGIALGLYNHDDVAACHEKLGRETENLIDDIYYSPYHPKSTESLTRKPESLLFEKAIAKHHIDPAQSWMVGDRARDLIPAKKLGMRTIQIGHDENSPSDFEVSSLLDGARMILKSR